MKRIERFSSIFIKLTMGVLGVLACSVLILAEGSPGDYNLLVASGFVCDPSDSSTCPAVAQTSQWGQHRNQRRRDVESFQQGCGGYGRLYP